MCLSVKEQIVRWWVPFPVRQTLTSQVGRLGFNNQISPFTFKAKVQQASVHDLIYFHHDNWSLLECIAWIKADHSSHLHWRTKQVLDPQKTDFEWNITSTVINSTDTSWHQCVEMVRKHHPVAEGSQLQDFSSWECSSSGGASRRFASKHDGLHLYRTHNCGLANASLLIVCVCVCGGVGCRGDKSQIG